MNPMDKDTKIAMQEAPEAEAPQEITAQQLGAKIAPQEESSAQQEQEDAMDAIRAGIGELFEDGWTTAELAAMCCDETARAMIAKGASVARAACAYLKKSGGLRKGAVPTTRMAAAGMQTQENAIERMTDEEFAAFAARANEAMKAGKKVRI